MGSLEHMPLKFKTKKYNNFVPCKCIFILFVKCWIIFKPQWVNCTTDFSHSYNFNFKYTIQFSNNYSASGDICCPMISLQMINLFMLNFMHWHFISFLGTVASQVYEINSQQEKKKLTNKNTQMAKSVSSWLPTWWLQTSISTFLPQKCLFNTEKQVIYNREQYKNIWNWTFQCIIMMTNVKNHLSTGHLKGGPVSAC